MNANTDIPSMSKLRYNRFTRVKIALGGLCKTHFIMSENLNFGQAIEALKQGKRVARQGWNGKGLFVFMQVPSEIKKNIVPVMQSLPQSVKDEFVRRFNDPSEQTDAIYYDNQLALVNPSNLITGWAPSTPDALADDWVVLD